MNHVNSNGDTGEKLRVFVFNVLIKLAKNEWADLCERFRTAKSALLSRLKGRRKPARLKPLAVIALRRDSVEPEARPCAKRIVEIMPGPGLRQKLNAAPPKD